MDKTTKCDTGATFSNWDNTLICYPDCYYQPRTEAEIAEIVQETYKRSGVVRTFGAGHSWSPLVPTSDTLINLDKFNRAVAIDKGQMRASVQAGIRIKDLITLLRTNGLGMKNLGSIAEQSIAGAISTATHGTGKDIGNLSTQIIAMNIVDGRGDVHSISQERDPELMSAARASLGALGIISQVTLQGVQDYNLKYKSEHHSFEDVLTNLDRYNADNDRLRLYWHTLAKDQLNVMTMNHTSAPITPKAEDSGGLAQDIDAKGILQPITKDTYDLHQWPGLGLKVTVNKKQQIEATFTGIDEEAVKPYDQALTVPMPLRHQESEYAIPIERAAEAVRVVRKLIEDHHFLDFILVEVRFVAADDIMLSPAYDRQVCYVGGYLGGLHADKFFLRFEAAMKDLQGRPHWGKHITLTADEARHMYPRLDRFNEIRRDFDPKGIFANPFVRNLFG